MLPALIMIAIPVAAIALSLISPLYGAAFIGVFLAIGLVRALRGGIDAARGYRRLRSAERVDWSRLEAALEAWVHRGRAGRPVAEPDLLALPRWAQGRFRDLVRRIAADPAATPAPSETVHAVIVAAYNEPYDVIARSFTSLANARIDPARLVVMFAYEARGGAAMRDTAARLERAFGPRFGAFLTVAHPDDLPEEIPGKGSNISYAGRALTAWLRERGRSTEHVLVTTLDCDNQVDPQYFTAVTCDYLAAPDRERVAFQPVSLFTGNIWHAPALTRIVAAGNSLWNLISTVRPLSLRNFASHTQPLAALIEMDYWSRRTIVEDGHQYWRSFFHFRGRYAVRALHLSITQDVVFAGDLWASVQAQFKQLCRWAYGASDVPYVGVRLFARERVTAFWPTLRRFCLLLESHVTLATLAPMLAIGAWLPVGVATIALWAGTTLPGAQDTIDLLPEASLAIQRCAMVGLAATILLNALLLPERPDDVPHRRWLGMMLQWVLLPLTLLVFSSGTAVTSQLRLFAGRYRERFVVTTKAVVPATGVPARSRQAAELP